MIRTAVVPFPYSGFVYCICHHERRAVKIGFSKNPARRLKQLQTGSADVFTLFDSFPADRSHETAFHHTFADRRINGEWFDDADNLITGTFGRLAWRERMAA